MRQGIDPQFDRHVQELLRVSTRDTAKYPDDPDWTDEAWEARIRVLVTLIYRTGAQAGLSHQYGRLDTTVERVRWLVGHDLASVDVSALLTEVEHWQEQAEALQGSYGVTASTIRSMIAEGFSTAFRKAADSMESAIAWKAIRDMDREEWGAILDFVVNPLIGMLREAEEQAKDAAPEVPWPLTDPELAMAVVRRAMSKGEIITREHFGLPPAGDKTEDQETTP